MSALLDTKKESYRSQRAASQGAGVTLVSGYGVFTASFECATRCAAILGNQALGDAGDGIYEVIPTYQIALEDIYIALGKLSARYSVALVEIYCDKGTSRFVPIWKITTQAKAPVPETPSTNVDDY